MDNLSDKNILLESGLKAVAQGKIRLARRFFREAAKRSESAEALTYWGWMEFQLGNTTMAMLLCQKAIRLDPELGNPYNDMGSYYVSLGKLDEAISWFERAVRAKRSMARQYPHINLGRVYAAKNFPRRAIHHFREALKYQPDDPELMAEIHYLEMGLN